MSNIRNSYLIIRYEGFIPYEFISGLQLPSTILQQFWVRKKSDKKFEAKTTSTDSNVNDRRSNFLLIMIQEIES